MKIIKSVFIVLFLLCIIVPTVFFNFTPDSVSEIDNRKLAENPFTQEGDLTKNIENYVSDRIGFRDEIILSYTVLNDKLFGKMVHPTYTYGEDGYIFGAGITVWDEFSDFHVAFADMVLALQQYCEARGVPFVFVFDPAKPAVYTEYLNKGINYNRSWVEKFFIELDKRGVNYVDNTLVLKELANSGETVFNQKFDANHWNDLGAFYGTKAVLENLNSQLPSVHVNEIEEFLVTSEKKTSLLVSDFPIDEDVPIVMPYKYYESVDTYKNEIELHPSYNTFGHFVNSKRLEDGSSGALVFQGSYMNGYGYKYFLNSFSEYVYIHDYQNVMELPYYFGIFKPDCVIFEVAEYTFVENYFDFEKMKEISYNKPLESYSNLAETLFNIKDENVEINKGQALTKIIWHTELDAEAVWLKLFDEYDMRKCSGGFEATVNTADFEKYEAEMEIHTLNGEDLACYK